MVITVFKFVSINLSIYKDKQKPPIRDYDSNLNKTVTQYIENKPIYNDELYRFYYNKTLLYLTYLASSFKLLKSFISINSIGKADESICFLPYLYDINPNGYFINVVCSIMIRERNNDYSVDFFKKMINDVDYLEEKIVKKLYLSFTYVICEKLVV